MWLRVNHTKPTNTLHRNQYILATGNYKSASGQLQNTVNDAMSITINRAINWVISLQLMRRDLKPAALIVFFSKKEIQW